MAKRPKAAETSNIAKLLTRVAPGAVTLAKPRYATERALPDVELTIHYRGVPTTHVADSIEAAAHECLDFLDDPGEDPVVPHWTRLSRFQRELVIHTLRKEAARYMTRALEAKVGYASSRAFGAFEAADAFQAAVTALDHEDVDQERAALPREPLSAPTPSDGSSH